MRILYSIIATLSIIISLIIEQNSNPKIDIEEYIILFLGISFGVVIYILFPIITSKWQNIKSELLLGSISSITAFILISVYAELTTMPINIIISLILGVITGWIYHIHVSNMIHRWYTKVEEHDSKNKRRVRILFNKLDTLTNKNSKLLQNIETSIIPLYNLIISNNFFRDFGKTVADRIETNQGPFIKHLLQDQSRLLRLKTWLYSLDEYLIMLEEFSRESSTLFCINQTLPIFWYSPKPNESTFVLNYGDEISNDKIHRIRTPYPVNKNKELRVVVRKIKMH
ncbi:MAG: hypothetical protein K9J16_08725 [Melioribacteraceae bacterium]|nr:hypothetical protein [Melioribacteraceae bacterium]MCF8353771.1 hypothetical protein [Melioribacteraceae bacterium]MCF8393607.1 hypothetical protein [Melioribacteraceae bacterium]MCF8419417.1 hypothetical protein [Melioribacteraceae bacterium]